MWHLRWSDSRTRSGAPAPRLSDHGAADGGYPAHNAGGDAGADSPPCMVFETWFARYRNRLEQLIKNADQE